MDASDYIPAPTRDNEGHRRIALALDLADADGWRRSGRRATGRNRGEWLLADDGSERFVKTYPDAERAMGEVFAGLFYARLGVPAAATALVYRQGRIALASTRIPGRVTRTKRPTGHRDWLAGRAADILLANGDVDARGNTIVGEDGRFYRLDNEDVFGIAWWQSPDRIWRWIGFGQFFLWGGPALNDQAGLLADVDDAVIREDLALAGFDASPEWREAHAAWLGARLALMRSGACVTAQDCDVA